MPNPSQMKQTPPSSNTAVDDAINSRQSVRAFLPTPVERSTVERLLHLAARSASGSNIQPWRVRVIAGDIKERLTKAIFDAVTRDGFEPYQREWNYYPVNWREPFLGRRRKIGWDMYSLLGVAKGDFEGTQRARMRNYEFFGAPVGMIFTLDEDLEMGSWLDLGIYLGALMIAARGDGLHTCPQAAFADFHKIIRPLLNIPEEEIIICGMALGHIDPSAAVNKLVTARAPLADYASFDGF
jgi:nitroreductase